MFKFLIISFLIFFLLYKLLGFFFRILLRGTINHHQQQQRQAHSQASYNKKPADGNVTVEYIPEPKKERKEKIYKGGEYIDYEELK